MLNIALPKGRLGEKVYAMFEKAGFECPAIKEQNRKLEKFSICSRRKIYKDNHYESNQEQPYN